MEILLLGLLGLGLYSLIASPSTGGGDVASDLKKLYAASPTTYNAVMAVLGNPSPVVLNQYAAQLYATYPALAKNLGDKALALVTKVVGRSGNEWYVWVKSTNGKTRYIDVLSGSQPIITYTQEGDDAKNRKYLSTYPNVDAAKASAAKSDFIG